MILPLSVFILQFLTFLLSKRTVNLTLKISYWGNILLQEVDPKIIFTAVGSWLFSMNYSLFKQHVVRYSVFSLVSVSPAIIINHCFCFLHNILSFLHHFLMRKPSKKSYLKIHSFEVFLFTSYLLHFPIISVYTMLVFFWICRDTIFLLPLGPLSGIF